MKQYLLLFRIALSILVGLSFFLGTPKTSLESHLVTPINEIEYPDTLSPVETVQKFLLWYQVNIKNCYSFKLVNQISGQDYSINMDQCKGYLKFLESSGFISETYIGLWWEYFQTRSNQFKDFPQNEGPPEGFDIDLVLLNQEPVLIFEGLEEANWKVHYFDSNNAIVKMMLIWPYDFELSKSKGKWQIDYISINDEP